MAEVPRTINSIESMRARLDALQEPLGQVLLRGDALLEEFGTIAPHPRDVTEDFPVTATSPINSSYAKELSIRLPGARLVIDRNAPDFPSFPLRRVTLWTPLTDGTKKQTVIKDISHQLPELPFEISVSIFNSEGTQHLGFVDYGYVDHEPHIQELNGALGEASRVASEIFA